jgi:hypothetical protein
MLPSNSHRLIYANKEAVTGYPIHALKYGFTLKPCNGN